MNPSPDNCLICGSSDTNTISSYKQNWVICNDCDCASRHRKDHYPLDKDIYKKILGRLKKWDTLYNISLNKSVVGSEVNFYSYYKEIAKKGIKGTKWEGVLSNFLDYFKKFNISLDNKIILDISGGPGFITEALSNVAHSATVTEFSQEAVDGMIDALKIKGLKYDYNSDDFLKVVKFNSDLILVIYSIGFCNNLNDFVSKLSERINKGGKVILAYSPPSLGLFMIWQFDDYTYTRCYSSDYIRKVFSNNGLSHTNTINEATLQIDTNKPDFITRQIMNFYIFKAKKMPFNVTKKLEQYNIIDVFEKK